VVAQLVEPPHPIVACVDQLRAALSEVTAYEPMYLSDEDKALTVLGIAAVERRLAGLKLRTMAVSKEMADQDGARDVAAWLAPRARADLRPLRAEQRLAEAIDQRWTQVAAGMTAGGVSVEQAQVIVRGLEALPARLGLEVIAKAEAHLVELAKDHDPTELRILARRILDLAAPEIAEGEEARRLEEEEKHARDHARLSLKPLGDGTTRISGLLPDAAGQRLLTYLDAYTSPRKPPDALSGEEDRIPYPRQLAHAFCSLLEHLDPEKLPEHGGDATTLMVTIPLESLHKDLGTGAILGGQPMSATQVRRLACTAGIIPAVLGGKGEVLDLGRTRRLFSRPQRRAIRLLHQTCAGEGCSIPATWSDIHHLKPWSQDGNTDLNDAVPACDHHHHLLHDPTYTHATLPNGKIRFHRRR
jgi:hypothetical protein